MYFKRVLVSGRIIFGFVSDHIENRLYLYNTALALCGLVTCMSAYFPDYYMLAAYSGSYGFLIGECLCTTLTAKF